MKIVAVIPIRTGSTRIENKNLRPFGDTTLLSLKIKKLKETGVFDDIVVNTNSEEAVQIAIENGVSYHRRDPKYATATCPGSDLFVHLAETTDTDVFCYCPCTTPFIDVETIRDCVQKYKGQKEYDSVTTVSDVKNFLWLDGKALNYDPKNAPPSQELPDIVVLTFGFSIVSKDLLIKKKNLIGDKPLFVKTSDIESIDIDNELDFYISEQIYKRTVLDGKSLLDKL